MGDVSFAEIVKACEPVFAAVIGLLVPPSDLKPPLAYAMLIVIVTGVCFACVKDGQGLADVYGGINMAAFQFASFANLSAAFKGKWGHSITHDLKANAAENNMDAANVYAVMNILSFMWTVPLVIIFELPTLANDWEHAVAAVGLRELVYNILASALFYFFYNEMAFKFTAQVGAVTSSVLNTAKRVIIIVVAAIVFKEGLGRNKIIGSAVAISGTFLYSYFSTAGAAKKVKGSKKKD